MQFIQTSQEMRMKWTICPCNDTQMIIHKISSPSVYYEEGINAYKMFCYCKEKNMLIMYVLMNIFQKQKRSDYIHYKILEPIVVFLDKRS